MTITVDIRPDVQAELARQAAAQGRAIESVAASLLEEAVHLPLDSATPPTGGTDAAVAEACERLKTFGKTHGLTLGNLTIRELRHEARP